MKKVGHGWPARGMVCGRALSAGNEGFTAHYTHRFTMEGLDERKHFSTEELHNSPSLQNPTKPPHNNLPTSRFINSLNTTEAACLDLHAVGRTR